MSYHGPSSAARVTHAERVHWAHVRVKDAQRMADANPNDPAYAAAVSARQREYDAIAHVYARTAEARAVDMRRRSA